MPVKTRHPEVFKLCDMDTLTHALSGALLARATEPKTPRADQLPRRLRMWIGFWAAAFPDSDFIISFINPLTYLSLHRGVTRSFILLPIWALGLAFVLVLIGRRSYSVTAFVGVCALGIGIHIAGDVINAFGTMILAPFSMWRVQIATTFVIDPFFTSIIVAGLIASMRWRVTRVPAVIGLVVLAAYVGFQAVLHRRAVAVGDGYIAAHRLEAAQSHAIPQPLSPFNWMVVVEQPQGYHLAYVSLLRKEIAPQPPADASWFRQLSASYRPVKDAQWQPVPRYGAVDADRDLAEAAWNSDALARYRGFALFPAVYRTDRGPERTCVWFNDLRFAVVGRTMPFRYGSCRDGLNGPWKVHRVTSDDNGTEWFEAIPD
jgi:inner membrane protein